MSYLFETEHYEMVLKAGDMERVMPRLDRGTSRSRASARATRTSTPPSSPSKFVKVVLSGAGGDELFGGYPWRYYRAVVNDDFEHYVDKYYALLAAAAAERDRCERAVRARSAARRRTASDRATSSATSSRITRQS